MKHIIVETTLLSFFAATGATFTAHEQVAVCGMSAAGAGIGAVFGTLMSATFSGNGLEKMTQSRRLAANWTLGFGTGFFGSWYTRDHWLPGYPVEIVGGGIGFLLAAVGVCVISLWWPSVISMIRNAGFFFGRRAAEKQADQYPSFDDPRSGSNQRGRINLPGSTPTVNLSDRSSTSGRDGTSVGGGGSGLS